MREWSLMKWTVYFFRLCVAWVEWGAKAAATLAVLFYSRLGYKISPQAVSVACYILPYGKMASERTSRCRSDERNPCGAVPKKIVREWVWLNDRMSVAWWMSECSYSVSRETQKKSIKKMPIRAFFLYVLAGNCLVFFPLPPWVCYASGWYCGLTAPRLCEWNSIFCLAPCRVCGRTDRRFDEWYRRFLIDFCWDTAELIPTDFYSLRVRTVSAYFNQLTSISNNSTLYFSCLYNPGRSFSLYYGSSFSIK